ncbi:MAG TPA: hypothetical protein ENJ35_04345 [Gammaproteobacteria bacterium]|nr:hypothetical protein [Gammaproteobacteria bacterium]
MNLKQFIAKIGDKESAKLFNCSRRAAQSWRLGDRIPHPKQSRTIVRVTASHEHGPVTYNGIYGES